MVSGDFHDMVQQRDNESNNFMMNGTRIEDEVEGKSSGEWKCWGCSECNVMVQETLFGSLSEKSTTDDKRHGEDAGEPGSDGCGPGACYQNDDITQKRRNESKDFMKSDGRRGEHEGKPSDDGKGCGSSVCSQSDDMMKERFNEIKFCMRNGNRHGEDEVKASNQQNGCSGGGVAEWNIRANPVAVNSKNPIRDVLESLPSVVTRDGKREISLAQGDPSAFGNLKPPVGAIEALVHAAESYMFNGYAHSAGLMESRRVIANCHSVDSELTADDVYITVGCSQAIQMCIEALAYPGANILLPKPGFPIYETFSTFYGLQCRHYNLLPDQDWEVDLEHLENLADSKTIAVVVCNPGNPSGSVYRYEHLSQIAGVAKRLKIPIIADEIYAHMVFGTKKFIHMATFSKKVPVLAAGGISKRWMVPGWRLGWIIVHDPHGILKRGRVVEALTRLVQMTIGTCSHVQAVIPNLLLHTSSDYYKKTLMMLKLGADLCLERVQQIKSLSCPSAPEGAMFMMVKIDFRDYPDLRNDVEFSAALRREELVTVLPGTAFGMINWIRIVFVAPLSHLQEAWDRIENFCQRHGMRGESVKPSLTQTHVDSMQSTILTLSNY